MKEEKKLELVINQAYSKDELEMDHKLKIMRFHAGFSLFYNKSVDKIEMFKIYAPEDSKKPHHRFYYQYQCGYNESYGS